MATTVVRGSTTITRLRQGDSLTASLVSTKSLIQYIEGDSISPNWEVLANQPIIYPFVRSSLTTAFITDITNVRWYLDNVLITAEDNRFLLGETYEIGGFHFPSLRVVKNLMLGSTSNKSIRAEFDVETGGFKTELNTTIDVQRLVVSESSYQGEIGVTSGGIITEEIPTVTLNAILLKGGQSVSAFDVEWWKIVAYDTDGEVDGLMELGKTGKEITLSRNDVDLNETILCRFIVGGTVRATATRDLMDLTDPYEMVFALSPMSGICTQTTPVITTPKIVAIDENGLQRDVSGFTRFAFSLYGGTTLIRNQTHLQEGGQSFETKYADFTDGGRNFPKLTLNVQTQEDW